MPNRDGKSAGAGEEVEDRRDSDLDISYFLPNPPRVFRDPTFAQESEGRRQRLAAAIQRRMAREAS